MENGTWAITQLQLMQMLPKLHVNIFYVKYLIQVSSKKTITCILYDPSYFGKIINILQILKRVCKLLIQLCVCVCVCVWGHVYVVYEDTNLYNVMGMTGITRRRWFMRTFSVSP